MKGSKVLLVTAAFAAVMVSGAAMLIGDGGHESPPEPSRTETRTADTEPEAPEQHIDTTAPVVTGEATEPREEAAGEAERPHTEQEQARDRARALGRIREELMRAEEEPGNLQRFFDRLDRFCEGVQDCDELLDEALDSVDPEMAAMIERIQERLPAYEDQMQHTRMSREDTTPRERYERIHELREQTLGVEETEAMFGQERAFAEYRFGRSDLAARAEQMAPEQRRQALDNLRSESFGEYQEALTREEGPLGRYQAERDLLLLDVEDETRRQQITREVRERHLDPETVERMEQRDERRREQQTEVDSYREAEQALREEMEAQRGEIPSEQWEQELRERMTELRREHFD